MKLGGCIEQMCLQTIVCSVVPCVCANAGPVRRARGFQEVDSLALGLERRGDWAAKATVYSIVAGVYADAGPVRRARGFQEVDSLAFGLQMRAHARSEARRMHPANANGTVCSMVPRVCAGAGPVRTARGFQDVDPLALGLERRAHAWSEAMM